MCCVNYYTHAMMGFASQLQMVGIHLSLVSFAGRWKLQAAIFRYLLHRQSHMIPIANKYWCGKIVNNDAVDIDQAEIDMVKTLPKDIDKSLKRINKFLAERSL
eukprot:511812_1